MAVKNPKGSPQNFKLRTGKKPYRDLTLKQKMFVKEYLKTGVKAQAYRAAFGSKGDRAKESSYGAMVYKKPKVRKAIEEALEGADLSDDFAARTLKEVVDKGKDNLDDTRPTDVLKALEMFFKLKGHLGTKTPQVDEREEAEKMSVDQIQKELEKLDRKQSRLLAMFGRAEDGKIE